MTIEYSGGGILTVGGYVDAMLEGDMRGYALAHTEDEARWQMFEALRASIKPGKAYQVIVIGPETQEQVTQTGIRFRLLVALLDHANAEIGDAVIMERMGGARFVDVPGEIPMRFEYMGLFPKVGVRALPRQYHRVFKRVE
jgi:hypothetical protein